MYDLHCHSYCSDGELAPAALVARAAARGVQVLALSDHDSLAGVAEAQQAAQSSKLTLIPAVEISVAYQKLEIHIVGLAVDPHAAALCDGLAAQQARRWRRAEAIADKLTKDGVNEVLAELRQRFLPRILETAFTPASPRSPACSVKSRSLRWKSAQRMPKRGTSWTETPFVCSTTGARSG